MHTLPGHSTSDTCRQCLGAGEGGEGGLSRQEWTPPMGREGEGTDDTQNVATAVHYDTFGLHSSCVFWL